MSEASELNTMHCQLSIMISLELMDKGEKEINVTDQVIIDWLKSHRMEKLIGRENKTNKKVKFGCL